VGKYGSFLFNKDGTGAVEECKMEIEWNQALSEGASGFQHVNATLPLGQRAHVNGTNFCDLNL
jgi:hypothetical protein